jgi:hypothetical protein
MVLYEYVGIGDNFPGKRGGSVSTEDGEQDPQKCHDRTMILTTEQHKTGCYSTDRTKPRLTVCTVQYHSLPHALWPPPGLPTPTESFPHPTSPSRQPRSCHYYLPRTLLPRTTKLTQPCCRSVTPLILLASSQTVENPPRPLSHRLLRAFRLWEVLRSGRRVYGWSAPHPSLWAGGCPRPQRIGC